MQGHGIPRSSRNLRASPDQPRVEGPYCPETAERGDQDRRSEKHDHDAPGRAAEGCLGDHLARRNPEGLLWRLSGMTAFRYQAIEVNGAAVEGVIEAEDRKAALHVLGQRGLFPSSLAVCSSNGEPVLAALPGKEIRPAGFRFGRWIKR